MSDRRLRTLNSDFDRALARKWINEATAESRVEIKGPQRTVDQNKKMWAMLTDISLQVAWYKRELKPGHWKLIFLDSLSKEPGMVVPNLAGDGVVNLKQSSSDLSKSEFSDLIELMFAFGALHEVEWSDPKIAEEYENIARRA